MNDQQLIDALKGAVGTPPDFPGRVESIRHRAGRARQRRLSEIVGSGALAVALIGGVVALNGPGGELLRQKPAVDTLAAAASRTIDTGSFRFELTSLQPWYESSGAVVEQKKITVKGVVDMVRVRSEISFGVDGHSTIARHIGDQRWSRTVGDGPFSRALPPGKVWVLQGTETNALRGDAGQTPDDYLNALRKGSSTTPRPTGTATVRGVQTNVYELEAERLPDVIKKTGVGLTAWKVYLDHDGLLRRTEVSYSVEGRRSSHTMDYFDFGVAVAIDPPPASEVISEADADAFKSRNPSPTPLALLLRACVAMTEKDRGSDSQLTAALRSCLASLEPGGDRPAGESAEFRDDEIDVKVVIGPDRKVTVTAHLKK